MVGAGVTVADLPSYASHNDLGTAVLLAAMHEAGVRRLVLGVVDGGLRRGPLRLPGARRRRRPRPRGREALDAGDFENHCPVCGRPLGWAAGRRGRPARPAQQLRREQGRPGALRRGVGAAGRRRGGRAALPQRLRAGDAAGHAVLRRRGDVPLRRSSAGEAAAGLRGRRPDARLRARRRRGPRQPARAATRCATAPPGRSRPTTSAPGTPVPIRRVAELVAGAPARDLRPGGHRRLPARRRPPRRGVAGAGARASSASRRRDRPRRRARRVRDARCAA